MQITGLPEPALRLAIFVAVFMIMAALEFLWPRRQLRRRRLRRWLTNVGMAGLASLLVRLLAMAPRLIGAVSLPLAAVGAALAAEQLGWGVLGLVAWPSWLEFIVAIVLLDFAIWLQHLASHKITLLWRLHRVHHADPEFDLTTGIRFHPIEIVLSMLYKIAWVLVLGPTAMAVLIFELILNAGAMFNHANVAIPRWLDAVLRSVIVTPDMHRIHHSVHPAEHDTNYGFNLSIWDRLFRTYTIAPRDGHAEMTIGLEQYQNDKPTRLVASLAIPFQRSDREH